MRIGCARSEEGVLANKRKKNRLAYVLLLGLGIWVLSFFPLRVAAATEGGAVPFPTIQFGVVPADAPEDVALSLQLLGLLTVLSLAPAILLMITSFTRIVVVLGFVQRAIGLQQSPP